MDVFIPPLPEDELIAQNASNALRGNAMRLERMRKRRKMRRLRIAGVLSVALAGVLFYFTGVYGASIALLGDVVDAVTIAMMPAAEFPITTNVSDFQKAEELANGFAVLGSRELVLYANGGAELRRIQHGYASPSITTSNTRICIYNRGAKDLKVESRTRNLFQQTMSSDILLAEMSENSTLGVFTKNGLSVFNSMFDLVWEWKTTAQPFGISFAKDNKQMAVSTVYFNEGSLGTKIYLFHLNTSVDINDVPVLVVESSIPLQMKYINNNQLLVVFDTFASIYDAKTGVPIYTYQYNARTLQTASLSSSNNTVLLFGDTTQASMASMVVLDKTLSEIGAATIGSRVTGIVAQRTSVQVLLPKSVQTYGLDGSFYGEITSSEPPLAIVPTQDTFLFTSNQVAQFDVPENPNFSK